MKGKIFFPFLFLYFLLFLILVIYSYTQVDLNLTLSTNSIYQLLQQKLTYLGYFQRLLSATIFVLIFILLYIFYLFILRKSESDNITLSQLKKILIISCILIFAYPAFSHDIFNYMFDARIVTKYHLSPYIFKALDFPSDPWIRFMHWTHRYYPYGLGWLLITLIPSVLGMGKFIFTLGIFKLMFLGSHLLNCRLIYKIAGFIDKKYAKPALIFYSLNPLILIETLVSPHNEILMLTFLLFSFFLLIQQKITWSVILLILSVNVKYLSAVFLPLYMFFKINLEKLAQIGLYLWLIGLIPVIISRELYPWYLIPIIGIAGVIYKVRHIRILTISISAAALIRYWPYLLKGDYSLQTLNIQQYGSVVIFLLLIVTGLILWGKSKFISY